MARTRRRRRNRAAPVVTYIQPTTRTHTTWTPSLIRNALSGADTGRLSTVADLCEWVMADSRVAADIDTRTSSLLGLDLDFEPALGRTEPVDALQDGDWWALHPESELRKLEAWGIVLGVGFGQLRPPKQPDELTGRFLPQFEAWHPRHFRYDYDRGVWVARTGIRGNEETDVVPGVGGWVVHCPYGAHRPWAHGLWRGLARWVLLKHYAIDDWGRHSENASRLFLEAPDKASREQRKELADDIKSAGRQQIIGLPNGFKAHLVEASADTRELYQAQTDTADKAITISIRGQNLGTDVEGGSRAAAEVHERMDVQRLRFDAATLRVTLREQSLRPYAELNFGRSDIAPWPEWDVAPPEDLQAKAAVIKTLAEGATHLDKLGVELDWEQVAEQYDVPVAQLRLREPQQRPPQGGQEPADEPASTSAASVARALNQKAPGYVEGQAYADALVDRGVQRGAEHLDGFLDDLGSLIEDIDSLDTARARIVDFFGAQDTPEEHAEMAERLFMLAQFAGVAAVRQDTPEIDDGAD
ncbi:MAG: DUF935 family protein [Bacteroidetes bacterium]|jgi:phage gp29-like protein|nr:DUF935 family protein [Bacteroidota bacterium]